VTHSQLQAEVFNPITICSQAQLSQTVLYCWTMNLHY